MTPPLCMCSRTKICTFIQFVRTMRERCLSPCAPVLKALGWLGRNGSRWDCLRRFVNYSKVKAAFLAQSVELAVPLQGEPFGLESLGQLLHQIHRAVLPTGATNGHGDVVAVIAFQSP